MNYVRHLNAFFAFVRTDNRLTSSHVSLYLALFHYWNLSRFHNPFSIYRDNIMQLSKIGSKNTYHKCIKELHAAKYIYYHPAPSRFQVVRISVIRLDTEPEQKTPYRQLDLFGTNNGTNNVPDLRHSSTDFDTGTVSKMGHLNKPNLKKQRETPTHEIFNRNDKIQTAINEMAAGVPNEGHVELPSLPEIEHHFFNHNYPKEEAIKFFNHYKALGWKIQGKTPIADWKPLVEKWMQNAMKWNTAKEKSPSPSGEGFGVRSRDVEYLYECFLEGKRIFHQITTNHFDQLKLSLDEQTIQQARQQRINEVAGTNRHSLNQLWDAYLKNDETNHLVQNDKTNLIALAKRLAVINHFHKLKTQSQ